MPHAVFNLGPQGTDADLLARTLIPGVAPGMGIRNIFARDRTKQALLIQDAWIAMNTRADISVGADASGRWSLKLSQEASLNPGLLLPVGFYGFNISTAVGQERWFAEQEFKAQGSVWAPRFVGVRYENVVGTITLDADLHIDYQVIEVPWWDWLIMWDFLDGVTDNSEEY